MTLDGCKEAMLNNEILEYQYTESIKVSVKIIEVHENMPHTPVVVEILQSGIRRMAMLDELSYIETKVA